jgi:hypothetical protein
VAVLEVRRRAPANAAPPQSLDEGLIEDWQLVAGTATAHRYQFALANARLVRDSQEAG